ncbi:HNH endonuclease [Longilinea arvoryzae]|uniref:HNH endonuclease n=1 Tax=Longilinea arvoryzae TaxID=360412 RepID=A0A0K8MZK9_9CHLR|nr:HNH endonuclease [Longilinea arvoryzae]GAP16082.1 HNH endonuclease [Longilinea arvoryzae]
MLTRTSLLIQQLVDSRQVKVNLETGEVFGLRGKVLKTRIDRSGYSTVSLARNHLPVHRIIAYAAFGEVALQAGKVITHRDGNPRNNAATNLAVRSAVEQRPSRQRLRLRLGWGVSLPGGEIHAAFDSRELAEEYAAWKYGANAAVLPVR